MREFFEGVYSRGIRIRMDGTMLAVMNHTDHFLFLTLHALKHLTGGGVGFRQMADIGLYAERYYEEIDWELVWRLLRRCRGASFLSDVLFLCEMYMGIAIPQRTAPCCPEELLLESASCGVFGNATQEQRAAAALIASSVTMGRAAPWSRLVPVIRLLFPGRQRMLGRHPELKEKPWLLPVCWAGRWLRFLGRVRRGGAGLAVNGVRLGTRRVQLLKKYGLAL